MGSNVILDIVGSILVGGLVLLMMFRLNAQATSNLYNSSSELNIQLAMTSVVHVMEGDFRKIGYCKDWDKISDPTEAIIYADTSGIKFLTDINDNGNVDTLSYYLGPTSELLNTANPRDRLLYRVVNSETPKSSDVGITIFRLTYFDALGNLLSTPVNPPGLIHTIQIDVQVENSEPIDSVYTTAFWRQIKLSSKNLQNR
jgi:type II secretory pathway component PulJ